MLTIYGAGEPFHIEPGPSKTWVFIGGPMHGKAKTLYGDGLTHAGYTGEVKGTPDHPYVLGLLNPSPEQLAEFERASVIHSGEDGGEPGAE